MSRSLGLDDNTRRLLSENVLLKLALSHINRTSPVVYSHLKPRQADSARLSVRDTKLGVCDMLVVLSTGYGKSLLFQLLPIYGDLIRDFRQETSRTSKSKTIIIAPLNAIIIQQAGILGDALVLSQKGNVPVLRDHAYFYGLIILRPVLLY